MQGISIANAIINNRLDLVQQFVNYGGNLEEFDEYGFTPLIESAIANNIEIAKLLLEHGAKAEQEDMVGGTALHWAVQNNNLEFVKLLLENSADPNAYSQSGEMPLIKPILRRQHQLRRTLVAAGADETFARDFINLKLLGHRFSLRGYVDMLTPEDKLAEVNLEGFVPEFSLGVFIDSLQDYILNFAARHQRFHFRELKSLKRMLVDSQELLGYQDYLQDTTKHQRRIRELLANDKLILPVTSEGHLLCIIRYQNYLVICDRRREQEFLNGIMIFKIRNPVVFNAKFCEFLLYEKKPLEYIYERLPKILKLEQVGRMLIEPQMSGNCSWANIEATMPIVLKLIKESANIQSVIDYDDTCVDVFRHWRKWDQERALHFFLSDFESAPIGRQAMIASLSAAIVFQRCDVRRKSDVRLAMRLSDTFNRPEFKYLVESYRSTYLQRESTAAGKNFENILDLLKL